jgi:REP element-mobilizing transposase RayT
MGRPLRINLAGGWYHVTARGHNRRAIFLDVSDRNHFLELLSDMTARHRIEVHAYVLMGNHYHLLVRTPEANLSQAIQWLNVIYSVWWNRKHQQCGGLFQGRFKAIIVEGGGWLLLLSQYIHYNPVAIKGLGLGRQGKALERQGWIEPTPEVASRRIEALRKHRWSSYPAYAGYEEIPDWLSTAEVLARVNGGRKGYRLATEKRLLAGQEENVWTSLRWGFVLGRESFVESLRGRLNVSRETSGRLQVRRRIDWAELVRCMEKMKGDTWASFCDRRGDRGRDITLWAARRLGGYTLVELAREVGGLDYTAIAQAIRRLESRAHKDRETDAEMRSFQSRLEVMYNVKT